VKDPFIINPKKVGIIFGLSEMKNADLEMTNCFSRLKIKCFCDVIEVHIVVR